MKQIMLTKNGVPSAFMLLVFTAFAHSADFLESWSKAKTGFYPPDNTANCIVQGDMGKWVIDATIDGSTPDDDEPDCGPIPHEVEIQSLQGDKLLRLTSGQSTQGCSDNLWAVFFMDWGSPLNNHLDIPINPDTAISFEETGALDNPQKHGWGNNCVSPPCYDSITLQLEDAKGNVLAYVLQRYETEPLTTRDHYYEIHLNPDDGFFSRNLHEDFSLIPTFISGTSIYSIQFNIDEHGWGTIDNLQISENGSTEEPHGSPDLTASFGKMDIPADLLAGTAQSAQVEILITNAGAADFSDDALMNIALALRPLAAEEDDDSQDIELIRVYNVSVAGLKTGKTIKENVTFEFPASLPENDYILVATLDADQNIAESSETNNTALSQESVSVSAPGIDLAASLSSPKLPDSVVSGDGTRIILPIALFNQGNSPCPKGQTIDISILARPADMLQDSSQDVLLALMSNISVSGLKPEKLKKINAKVFLPAGIQQGNYVLAVQIDSAGILSESNESNNFAFTSGINVETGYIDLVASVVKNTLPAQYVEGSNVKAVVQLNLANQGNVALPKGQKIKIRLYAQSLTTQQQWDIVPVNKQFASLSGLVPGKFKKYSGAVLLPELPEDTYQILASIDSDLEVPESDETNNSFLIQNLTVLSAAQQLVGNWEAVSIQGAPGKVDASNSTWTFNSNGTYYWFLYYEPYYDVTASGSYTFDGKTLSLTGSLVGQLFDTNSVELTIKKDTLSFKDNDNDKWTYKKAP